MRSLSQFYTFLSIGLIYFSFIDAAVVTPISNGPFNEAFISKPFGTFPLQSVDRQPPEQIFEDIPFQVDSQTIWIPGYWEWVSEVQEFIWVTGVWRRPPPGMQWLKGSWEKLEQGWVRIPGFWSNVRKEQLQFLSRPPPEAISENPGFPPAPENFWMSGYWHYFPDSSEYGWVPGSWQALNPDWVLIPARYIWQQNGYVFIPAYWDWPIMQLGKIYYDAAIDKNNRRGIVLQPLPLIDDETFLKQCFKRYPDYLCYFQHHFHLNPKHWILFQDLPPWWVLPSWWCFKWHDQWALWWWYTHPGYPQPAWVTPEINQHITKPSRPLVLALKNLPPPLIVTPRGVISVKELTAVMAEVDKKARVPTGNTIPVLPSNPDILQDIRNTARPKIVINKEDILFPAGSLASIKTMSPELTLQPLILLNAPFKEILKNQSVRPSLITPTLPKTPAPPIHPIKMLEPSSTESPVNKIEEEKPIFYKQQPSIEAPN